MSTGKKKIVRRPKGTSSKTGPYFNDQTQLSIVEFQDANSIEEKHKIYVEGIKPAFDKLVENLIFIHGFVGLYDTYEDLKSDAVTFLYQTIHKFDNSKGKKAFSYFNIVAKNFLTIKSKQRSSKMKRNVDP